MKINSPKSRSTKSDDQKLFIEEMVKQNYLTEPH